MNYEPTGTSASTTSTWHFQPHAITWITITRLTGQTDRHAGVSITIRMYGILWIQSRPQALRQLHFPAAITPSACNASVCKQNTWQRQTFLADWLPFVRRDERRTRDGRQDALNLASCPRHHVHDNREARGQEKTGRNGNGKAWGRDEDEVEKIKVRGFLTRDKGGFRRRRAFAICSCVVIVAYKRAWARLNFSSF